MYIDIVQFPTQDNPAFVLSARELDAVLAFTHGTSAYTKADLGQRANLEQVLFDFGRRSITATDGKALCHVTGSYGPKRPDPASDDTLVVPLGTLIAARKHAKIEGTTTVHRTSVSAGPKSGPNSAIQLLSSSTFPLCHQLWPPNMNQGSSVDTFGVDPAVIAGLVKIKASLRDPTAQHAFELRPASSALDGIVVIYYSAVEDVCWRVLAMPITLR